jgi:hypothetical protein
VIYLGVIIQQGADSSLSYRTIPDSPRRLKRTIWVRRKDLLNRPFHILYSLGAAFEALVLFGAGFPPFLDSLFLLPKPEACAFGLARQG